MLNFILHLFRKFRIGKSYIPFGRPSFTYKEIRAVKKVIKSGWIGMGSETISFESDIKAFIGVPQVVCVNSCTSALFLALVAAGVADEDEVICPSLTWCSTANVVFYAGATPVFADIDPRTYLISFDSILSKITHRTKAVIVVHFGGLAVDVFELRRILPDNIIIIEDAAHAFGSKYIDGTMVGSSGNLTCFSFYANKNISTGDGGAISLLNESLAEKIQSLRQNAMPINAWKRFTHSDSLLLSPNIKELGYKMNYTDINAALGRIQLSRWNEMARHRRMISEVYATHIRNSDIKVSLQEGVLEDGHSRHLFVVELNSDSSAQGQSRDDVIQKLRAKNIGATLHYAPLHVMPLYISEGKIHSQNLPITEKVSKRILTLPISASISRGEAEYVVSNFIKVLSDEE